MRATTVPYEAFKSFPWAEVAPCFASTNVDNPDTDVDSQPHTLKHKHLIAIGYDYSLATEVAASFIVLSLKSKMLSGH